MKPHTNPLALPDIPHHRQITRTVSWQIVMEIDESVDLCYRDPWSDEAAAREAYIKLWREAR